MKCQLELLQEVTKHTHEHKSLIANQWLQQAYSDVFRKCITNSLVKTITKRQLKAPSCKEKVHKIEDRIEAARIAVCQLNQASRDIQQLLAVDYDLKASLAHRKRHPGVNRTKHKLPTDCLTEEERVADDTAKREIAKHCLRNLHVKTDKGGVLKKAICLLQSLAMADRAHVKKIGAWRYSLKMFDHVRVPSHFDTKSVLEWVPLDAGQGNE